MSCKRPGPDQRGFCWLPNSHFVGPHYQWELSPHGSNYKENRLFATLNLGICNYLLIEPTSERRRFEFHSRRLKRGFRLYCYILKEQTFSIQFL